MNIKINSAESSGNLITDYYDSHVHEATFIGVCLNHRMAGNAYLRKLIKWTIPKTKVLRIVVMDSLEGHNLKMFNNLSYEEACKSALREGDCILRRIHKILSHNKAANVEVIRFHDLLKQSEYQKAIKEIRSLHSSNNEFQNDVDEEVKGFIARVKQTKPKRYKNYDINETDDLNNYIIEEVGIYLELFRQGFKTEIYPGKDSPLLLNLANGKYGKQFLDYKNRTHISIEFDI